MAVKSLWLASALLSACIFHVTTAQKVPHAAAGWIKGRSRSFKVPVTNATIGACGYGELATTTFPGSLVATVHPSNRGSACGTCLQLACIQANCTSHLPLNVQVVGTCPDCSPNEVQLPAALYGRMLPVAQQPVFIEYRVVNCEPKGDIVVRVTSAKSFNATAGTAISLAFLNVIGPANAIASVAIRPAGAKNAQKLRWKSHNALWRGRVVGAAPWSLQIKTSLKQTLALPGVITAAKLGDYPTKVQLTGYTPTPAIPTGMPLDSASSVVASAISPEAAVPIANELEPPSSAATEAESPLPTVGKAEVPESAAAKAKAPTPAEVPAPAPAVEPAEVPAAPSVSAGSSPQPATPVKGVLEVVSSTVQLHGSTIAPLTKEGASRLKEVTEAIIQPVSNGTVDVRQVAEAGGRKLLTAPQDYIAVKVTVAAASAAQAAATRRALSTAVSSGDYTQRLRAAGLPVDSMSIAFDGQPGKVITSSPAEANHGTHSTGALVGGIIGGAACGILVLLAAWCTCRRCRRRRALRQHQGQLPNYDKQLAFDSDTRLPPWMTQEAMRGGKTMGPPNNLPGFMANDVKEPVHLHANSTPFGPVDPSRQQHVVETPSTRPLGWPEVGSSVPASAARRSRLPWVTILSGIRRSLTPELDRKSSPIKSPDTAFHLVNESSPGPKATRTTSNSGGWSPGYVPPGEQSPVASLHPASAAVTPLGDRESRRLVAESPEPLQGARPVVRRSLWGNVAASFRSTPSPLPPNPPALPQLSPATSEKSAISVVPTISPSDVTSDQTNDLPPPSEGKKEFMFPRKKRDPSSPLKPVPSTPGNSPTELYGSLDDSHVEPASHTTPQEYPMRTPTTTGSFIDSYDSEPQSAFSSSINMAALAYQTPRLQANHSPIPECSDEGTPEDTRRSTTPNTVTQPVPPALDPRGQMSDAAVPAVDGVHDAPGPDVGGDVGTARTGNEAIASSTAIIGAEAAAQHTSHSDSDRPIATAGEADTMTHTSGRIQHASTHVVPPQSLPMKKLAAVKISRWGSGNVVNPQSPDSGLVESRVLASHQAEKPARDSRAAPKAATDVAPGAVPAGRNVNGQGADLESASSPPAADARQQRKDKRQRRLEAKQQKEAEAQLQVGNLGHLALTPPGPSLALPPEPKSALKNADGRMAGKLPRHGRDEHVDALSVGSQDSSADKGSSAAPSERASAHDSPSSTRRVRISDSAHPRSPTYIGSPRHSISDEALRPLSLPGSPDRLASLPGMANTRPVADNGNHARRPYAAMRQNVMPFTAEELMLFKMADQQAASHTGSADSRRSRRSHSSLAASSVVSLRQGRNDAVSYSPTRHERLARQYSVPESIRGTMGMPSITGAYPPGVITGAGHSSRRTSRSLFPEEGRHTRNRSTDGVFSHVQREARPWRERVTRSNSLASVQAHFS